MTQLCIARACKVVARVGMVEFCIRPIYDRQGFVELEVVSSSENEYTIRNPWPMYTVFELAVPYHPATAPSPRAEIVLLTRYCIVRKLVVARVSNAKLPPAFVIVPLAILNEFAVGALP
jgi:hypothetical protein